MVIFLFNIDKPVVLFSLLSPRYLHRNKRIPNGVIRLRAIDADSKWSGSFNPFRGQPDFIPFITKLVKFIDEWLVWHENVDSILLNQAIFPRYIGETSSLDIF